MPKTDNGKKRILKNFGIKNITEVYLVTSNALVKQKKMCTTTSQSLYGGIDISKNDILSRISRQDFLIQKEKVNSSHQKDAKKIYMKNKID